MRRTHRENRKLTERLMASAPSVASCLVGIRLCVICLVTATTFAASSESAETHDLFYLADSGVVVVRVSVTFEGMMPRQSWERYLDSLYGILDKDSDGTVTVEEAKGKIATAREAQQFQEMPSPESNLPNPAIDVSPKDGKLTKGELASYFKRIGLSPFSVQVQPRVTQPNPNNPATGDPNALPPLFERLDTNSDKKLSRDELTSALDVLKKLDRDDDETISVAELQQTTQPQPQRANRPNNSNNANAAIPFVSIDGNETVPKMIRRIIDKYDSTDPTRSKIAGSNVRNQKLSDIELGISESQLKKFDLDGEGQLDFDELRQFVNSPEPNIELSIDVSSGEISVTGVETKDVRKTSDRVTHIQLGNTQLSWSTTPSAPMIDVSMLLMPLFMGSDANSNGYLEKDESGLFTQFGSTYEDIDEDKNGKIFLDELTAYMTNRIDAARSRMVLTIVEQGRTLFDILDF
ncbi:MAG: hypothetical protein FJ267_08435, partial [Planctomycetes bacterium]|nr:hypothetical protein [Planctomycetota bacterium]